MRRYTHIHLLFLFFTPFLSSAQVRSSIIEKITYLHENNQRDSALNLVNRSIPRYSSLEHYDTLSALYREKAIIHAAIKTPAEALPTIDSAIMISDRYLKGDSYESLMNQIIKGSITHRNYQLDEAKDILEKLLPILEEQQDRVYYNELKSITTNNLGWIYYVNRQYDPATQYALTSLETGLKHDPDTLGRLLIKPYQVLGSIYLYTSKIDSALHYLTLQYLSTKKNFPPDHPNIGIALNGLAGVYFNKGEYSTAKKLFEEEEQNFFLDYQKTGNNRYLSIVYENLGLLYTVAGEIPSAIKYLEKSLDLKVRDFGRNNIANVAIMTKLADAYNQIERYEEALLILDEALSIQTQNSPEDLEAIALIHMQYPGVYHGLGNFEKEHEFVSKAYSFYELNQVRNALHLNALNDYTLSMSRLGKTESAVESAKEGIDLAQEIFGTKHHNTLNAKYIYAQVLYDAHQLDSAQLIIDEAKAIYNPGNNHFTMVDLPKFPVTLSLFTLQADILRASQKYNETNLVDLVDQFRDFYTLYVDLFQDESTLHLINQKLKNFYNVMIYMAFQVDLNELILELVESYKSNYLNTVLNNNLIDELQDIPQEIRDRKEVLESQYRAHSIAYIEDSLNLSEKFQSYLTSRKQYIDFLDSIDISFTNADWGETLEIAADISSETESILHYYIADSLLYKIFIQDQTVNTEVTPWNPVEQMMDSLISSDWTSDIFSRDLYTLLLPSTQWTDLIIIPDGSLNYVSIEGLKDENGSFVIEKHGIRYGYSISALRYQHEVSKNDRGNDILSFTPGFTRESKSQYELAVSNGTIDSFYLNILQQPFMLRVAEFLRNLITTGVHKVDIDATEEAFKASTTLDYTLIHLGTHGIIDDNSPLMSRLILAKSPMDSIEDGYLHSYEIFNQEINANLAVLAACNTGSTVTSLSGEGIQSMAHSFTYAGCPSLLVSLWNIDEKSSAEILQGFYTYLKKGFRKSEALRKAKLDFLRSDSPARLSPQYWAGIVVLGNDAPLFEASNWQTFLLIPLFLLAALSIYFYQRKANRA